MQTLQLHLDSSMIDWSSARVISIMIALSNAPPLLPLIGKSAVMFVQSTPFCSIFSHYSAMSLSAVVYASEVSQGMQEQCLLALVTHSSCAVETSVKSLV